MFAFKTGIRELPENSRFSKIIFLITLSLIIAPLTAQQTLSSVQRELDRVEREIEREKELHKQEKKQAEEFEKLKRQKMAAIREQIQTTKNDVQQWRGKLSSIRNQKGALAGQVNRIEAKEKAFRDTVAQAAKRVKKSFETDFPFRRADRIDDLETLITALEQGSLGSEEGMNRLFAILSNAIDFGYSTEAFAGTLNSEEGTWEGTFLRAGAALQAFASHDGKQTAYLYQNKEGEYKWKTDLSPEVRGNILHAIRVAEGKEPPSLVYLPLQLPAEEENEGGEQ